MLASHTKTILETLGRNPIHPFPARMAPGIAFEALGDGKSPLRVLDPMSGSGTVLAVARANGHRAFGVDIDPLSVLLAGVWTRTIDPLAVNDKALEVLGKAKEVFKRLNSARAYPRGRDIETQEFIRYWFDDYARRQLSALSRVIEEVSNEPIRDALWSGFSRLIITKSAGASLAMDLSHSRPHRKFKHAPVKPFNRFLSAVDTVVKNCPQRGSDKVGPVCVVKNGDARELAIASRSIDLVLTSPPYLNAIDYMRCSKFSLVWMGYNVGQIRQIRGESIGTESSSQEAVEAIWVKALIKELELSPALAVRENSVLSQYVWDMGQALAETSRVLRAGGRAVYVVGDSTVKGTFVRNSSIVESVARQHGLIIESKQSRELPANRRYMPPPNPGSSNAPIDTRMRHEVVMLFKKTEASCAYI